MNTSDDEDDLIGDPRVNVHKRREAGAILDRLVAARRKTDDALFGTIHVGEVAHGVTIGFLSQVFNMDAATVRKRLKDCPPLARRKAGFTYDLAKAASYLVKPTFNVEQYLKTMRPSELPTHLQEAFWNAKRKQQQWEEDAGVLWREDRVMEVFADLFGTIRTALQLWPETVEEAVGLTEAQRDILVKLADALQTDIHKRLTIMPKKKRTLSTLDEAPAEQIVEIDSPDLDDEEDVLSLV